MPSPPDDDRENEYARLLDVPLPSVELPTIPAVSELRAGLEGLVDDAPLDPAAVEDAFADADAAPLADAEIEASAVPEGAVETVAAVEDGATGTIEAGGETVAAATLMPAYGDEYALGPERVTRNGGPVGPSDRDDPATFTVSPLGVPRGDRNEFAGLCDVLLHRTGDLRRLGCAQAALAMVASGELDAVVATRPLDPWDSVAGVAMVQRAGGMVTDALGDPWHPHAEGLVASNGNAHDALVDAARDVRE